MNPLQGLPLDLFDLPNSCNINLTGCPFSGSVLERIRERVESPDYSGPRISYSIQERSTLTTDRPLGDLLRELYSLSGKTLPEDLLENIEGDNLENLRAWLGRLAYISDFMQGGDKQRQLAGRVTEFLELAKDNEIFKELFLRVIEEASTTCGDRMALSIIHLGLQEKLARIDLGDHRRVADFLTDNVWPVQLLEKIAREKIPSLRFYDEIEVYLGYLIRVSERLGLELDIRDMLYFACSSLMEEDIETATQTVRDTLNNPQKKYEFLAYQDQWRKMLEQKRPEEYTDALCSENPIEALISLTKQILEQET